MPYINEGDKRASEVDSGVKNKWRWNWLDERGPNKDGEIGKGEEHRVWCRKTERPGECFCVACGKVIKYSSTGKRLLLDHSKHPHLNSHVYPRDVALEKDKVSENPGIMWSNIHGKCLPRVPETGWGPNHFVVCLPKQVPKVNLERKGICKRKSVTKESDIRSFFSKKRSKTE